MRFHVVSEVGPTSATTCRRTLSRICFLDARAKHKSLSKRAVCSFAFGKSCRASAEIRAHDAQAWPCSIALCRAVRSVVFSWRFTFARFSMKSCSMSELPCAAALWSNGSKFSFSTRSTDSTSFFANSNVFLHPSSSQYGLALGACNLVGPGQMRLIVRKLAT